MKVLLTEKERKARKAVLVHRYYMAHKEEFLVRVKRWAKENPLKVKENALKSRKRFEGTPKHIYHVLKSNSLKKGRKFELEQGVFLEWYLNLDKACFYCGLDEKDVSKWCKGFRRLSIDRIINDYPYQIGNMVLACPTCNKVKSNLLSFDEMREVGALVISKRYLCE